MGIWGVELYNDDIACDIKEEYINFLKVGMSNEKATENLINNYNYIIEDEEDGPIFWLALADTQWKYGRLLQEVKDKALMYIESGVDLDRWQKDKKQYNRRQEILMELKGRLKSTQPEEKKVSKLVLQKSNWEIGDVLLYQILNEELVHHKWYKKYVLLKVVGISETNIGSLPRDLYHHEQSIISLYNWIGNESPDLKLIKNLKFILLENYFDSLFGKRAISTGIINFTKKELKKLNIQVILKEINNLKESESTDSGRSWYNIHNFDNTLIRALEEAKEMNDLIDYTDNNG